MASIRAKVKEITAPRSRLKWPIGDLVAELNPVLRGWGNYFRWGNSARKFSQIDDYVRERLALFDSKKRQKPGRRWGEVHTYARTVRLGIHRLSGSVRYIPTCDSDQVNTVGEPCAREPHAQFDEGRLARRLAEPAAYSTTARCRGRENPPTGQGILLGARDLRDRRDADEIGEQDLQAELAGLQEHAR